MDGETHAEGEAPGAALLINRLRKVYMGGFPSEVSLPTIIPVRIDCLIFILPLLIGDLSPLD